MKHHNVNLAVNPGWHRVIHESVVTQIIATDAKLMQINEHFQYPASKIPRFVCENMNASLIGWLEMG